MNVYPDLTELERRVLMEIPALFPDRDSDDLHIPGADRESISYAIQHLIGSGLATASAHEGVNPFAHYYRDVELSPEGEQLRRHFARPWVWRFVATEWKWLATTLLALTSLGLSILNLWHQGPR